jgi:hypothetical protein
MRRIMTASAFLLSAIFVFAPAASAQCPENAGTCSSSGLFYVGNGFGSGNLGSVWGGNHGGYQNGSAPPGEVHIATKAKDVQIYLNGYYRGLSGNFRYLTLGPGAVDILLLDKDGRVLFHEPVQVKTFKRITIGKGLA